MKRNKLVYRKVWGEPWEKVEMSILRVLEKVDGQIFAGLGCQTWIWIVNIQNFEIKGSHGIG